MPSMYGSTNGNMDAVPRRVDLATGEMHSPTEEDKTMDLGDISAYGAAPSVSHGQGSSTLQMAWNIANAVQSFSALSLPYAISKGGLIALVGFLVIGVLSSFTGKILIECMYDTLPRKRTFLWQKRVGVAFSVNDSTPLVEQERRRVRLTYIEIGERWWPRGGRVLVLVVQCAELLGVCTLSLVLLGHVVTQLADQRIALDQQAWTAICAAIVLPTVFLPRLSQVSWLSLVGLLTMTVAVILIIAYSLSHPFKVTSYSQLPGFDIKTCPVAIGIVVFSYAAHAQFPDMERDMAKPHQYPLAINLAFVYVTIVYLVVGIFGFLTFGDETDEIVSKDMTKPIRMIINILLVVHLLVSYALPMFPVAYMLERMLRRVFPLCADTSKDEGLTLFYHLTCRTFLVGITLLIAVTVPHFSLLMAFIGSLTCILICFVFPCVFHLSIHGQQLTTPEKAIDVLVAVVSTSAGAVGVYASLLALIS